MIDLDTLARGVAQSLLRSTTPPRAGNLQQIVHEAFKRGYVLGTTIRHVSVTHQCDGGARRAAPRARGGPVS